MSGKITKLRMWGAINFHFQRIGQRIRCVEKLKKRELEEIILQNNINIDEEYAIREESDRIDKQESDANVEKIRAYVATLDDEGKEKFKEQIKEQINKAFKNPFQVQRIYNSIFENI
jgi:hypothetical protein